MNKLFLAALISPLASGIILLIAVEVSGGTWAYATYVAIFALPCSGLFILMIPELRAAARQMFLMPIRVIVGSPFMYRVLIGLMVRNAEKQETYDNLRLLSANGDPAFFTKTRQALELLKTRDPLNYQRVQNFLRLITDFSVGHYDPYYQAYHANRFELKEEPLESYASGIIHEAVHGRLQHCRIPYTGNAARHESICKQVQLRFLARIGAQGLTQSFLGVPDWWVPEAWKERVARYTQSTKAEMLEKGGVVNRLGAGGLTLIQKFAGEPQADGEPRIIRAYKQGVMDVSEVDYDGDGKPDGWLYAEGDTLLRAERDLNRDGRVDHWGHWVNGLLIRSEWDTDGDGRADEIGCVKYFKQQTESAVYWFTVIGELFQVTFRAGNSTIGQADVHGGVVTTIQGRARHKVGEKISETLTTFLNGAT